VKATQKQDEYRPPQLSEEVLTKKEKKLRMLMQAESAKASQLLGPDTDFGQLVKQDEMGEQHAELFDEKDRDIIGFKREKKENMNAVKKPTTE
jgi:hypothetical protein